MQKQDFRPGQIVASYDVDSRRSGFGRGSDDVFMPDIERLDREAAKTIYREKMIGRAKSGARFLPILVGIALFAFAFKKLRRGTAA